MAVVARLRAALVARLVALRVGVGVVTLAALGALGFLTRVPIGTDESAWIALTERPAAMVVAAYPIGAALSIPFVLGGGNGSPDAVASVALPVATTALLFPVVLLAVTGITHLDGLADVGDAAVVHGDAERRRSVLLDTEVGVGALVAGGVALLGLTLAAAGLATAPVAAAVAVVLAAEVGAKLGMATLASVAPSLFGTLGAQFEGANAYTVLGATVLAAPAVVLPALLVDADAALAAVGAVLAGPLAALGVGWWAHARLDGVNGDCFGATNEIGRLVGLHVGLWLLTASLRGAPVRWLALEVAA